MGAKTRAFAIFPTPLISHYPLPLKWKVAEIACLDMALPGVTQGRELILKTERN
jgi:hypothetical protein